jgi:hypothetical protein
MLIRQKVAEALETKRDAFRQGIARAEEAQERYLAALDELALLTSDRVDDRLGGIAWPGARASDELDRNGVVLRFAERWPTAREARIWALERLKGVPTLAVDGSQIAPSKEFAVPTSLVQVAWFENYHDAARPYVKDVRNVVLAPNDPQLESGEAAREVEEYVFAESRLNQCRFALEMDVAVERLSHLAAAPPPVVFIDGTFVLSFTSRMIPRARAVYLQALFRLLEASERYRVPVVGYVDTSMAADLATMLQQAFDLPPVLVADAQLLRARLEPFDRTITFQCARGDVLPMYADLAERDWSKDLYFVYLKTGRDRAPARLDFPRWILEAGLLDHVVDVVRAEAVVGSGYPYALETADAAAVLTTEDRLTFYRLFHDFAHASGLEAALPGKSISKAHRRS